MRKTTILLLTLLSTLPLSAQKTCKAEKHGDTLTLSTGAIERHYLWNDGNLITLSLINLQTGDTLRNHATSPDFVALKTFTPQKESQLDIKQCPSNGIRPECTQASITQFDAGMEIKRVFTLFAQAPAILCETYVRQPEGAAEQASNLLVDNPILDALSLPGKHWNAQTIEFSDATDFHNNLVKETNFIPYQRLNHQGNLLFALNAETNQGIFILKEAPNGKSQVNYRGIDFMCDFGNFKLTGWGISPENITTSQWTRAYACVVGLWHGETVNALISLRQYLKSERILLPSRDEMIMANTWGDRGQDIRINESFCLNEIEKGANLGITHFQLDDGWQSGKSPNSALAQGSFKDIWKNKNYWLPDPTKFPNGLTPVVERAKALGIKIGLWFNPSIQNNLEDWEKDADAIIQLNRKYGIEVFKIDGLELPTKQAEQNLRNLYDKVLQECGNNIVFNMDATAGQRAGYYMMNNFGNIFLENRYTDWGNYYPYQTLRNLWQLSKYVPAEKLQIEFLNLWRNANQYPKNDIFAPQNYTFAYLFAITMAAQPLAWFEMGNLPQEAYQIANLVKKYRSIQHEFHQGIILPIGETPNGRSWTGFQSMNQSAKQGFLIVYRENNNRPQATIKTYLPPLSKLVLQPIVGNGKKQTIRTSSDGSITMKIDSPNDFVLYRYTIQ